MTGRSRRTSWRHGIVKPGILVGLGMTVLAAARVAARRPASNREPGLRFRAVAAEHRLEPEDGVRRAVRLSLSYAVPPIWLTAAGSDWLCHRRSRIEVTTGPQESLIHILMMAEMGLPVLAAVFLEIRSPIVLLMAAAFLVHEATAYWDLRVAVSRREVTPVEQMVHSFMEMMPLVALWLVGTLRADELRALSGMSRRAPDFSVRLKQEPLPSAYPAGLLSAIALFGGALYIEELWRSAQIASSSTDQISAK